MEEAYRRVPRPTSTRKWLLIAGGLLYAAAGLTASLSWFPLGDIDVESDFYAELGPAAQRLAAGDIDLRNHPYKGPLQPLLTAVVHGVLGPLGVGWYRAAVGVSLLAGVLALAATHRLARTLAGERVALAAVLLMAACHLVFSNTHKAASDMLFLGLATAAVAVALDDGPPRPRRWFIAGLLAGGAFLTRYIGILLPVWLAGVALWRSPEGEPKRPRRDAALAAAGFLVLAAPWCLLSLAQTGDLLASRNGENVAREFAGAGLGRHLLHYLLNIPRHLVAFARTGVGIATVVAAAAGMAVAPRGPHAWRLRALLAWSGLYLAALAGVFYLPRFWLPLVPVLTIFIAILLVGGTLPWLAARRHLLGWLGVAAFLVVWVPRILAVERFHRADVPTHLLGTVAYLRPLADATPPPALMARKAHAAFLAGLSWRAYPTQATTARAFVADAAARGADLILTGPLERHLGGGGFALEVLDRLDGLTRVHASDGNVVYRLDRALPADRLGRDVLADSLAAGLANDIAADPRRGLAAAEALSFARLQAGEHAAAQAALQALVDAYGADPRLDLRRVRVNLAWLCLQTGDHAAGAAALEPALPAFAAGNDRLLEARALDDLGRHLAALGRTTQARLHLQRAAILYDTLDHGDDAGAVRDVLVGLGS